MVGELILRIVSFLLLIVLSWETSKKDAELTALVLAIYTDMLLLVVVVILIVVVVSLSLCNVKRSVHACGCYVIINPTSYTQVLIIVYKISFR